MKRILQLFLEMIAMFCCNIFCLKIIFSKKTKKKKNLNFEANDYKLLFYLKELLKINEVSEYISL